MNQSSVETILLIVLKTIYEKKNMKLLRNTIALACSKAIEDSKFKTALLTKMYDHLRSGLKHIFDVPNSREALWDLQEDLANPLLGDRRRLNTALDKWKKDKELDSLNLCVVNFLFGAVVISSCSFDEFKSFLQFLERKDPIISPLLILHCCRYLQFGKTEQNFSDLIECTLLSKYSSSELLYQLKNLPESEGLAGVVFDLIRRKKGSEGFIASFCPNLFPV